MSDFGRYNLLRRVGSGGMAEIWKARVRGPAGFEKILAIKKVLPSLVEEAGRDFIEMFVEEAKLVATLMHPNIVQVFDFGQAGRHEYFIAMEYVAGQNLLRVAHRLEGRGESMPIACALLIGAEAARGLAYAHGRTDATGTPLRIVHRDISPQNLLLSYSGEVKIADFGIAKVADSLQHTAQGHVRGKLSYMSPEQASAKTIDHRSDLFSLGVVLYELFTRQRLFKGKDNWETLGNVTRFTGLTDRQIEALPPEARDALRTALDPDPAARFQDGTQMEAALTASLGSGALIEARKALAALLQRAFEEELSLETSVDAVPVEEGSRTEPDSAVSAAFAPTGSTGDLTSRGASAAGAGAGLQTAVEGDERLFRDKVGTETLLSPASTVVERPARLPSSRRRRRRLGPSVYGLFGLAAVALATAGYFAGRRGTPPAGHVAPASRIGDAGPAEGARFRPTVPDPLPPEVPLRAVVHDDPPATAAARTAPTARPPIAPPQPAAGEPAPAATGTLSVRALPWVEVWVDGERVARETPLQGHRLPAGPHVLTVANPALGFRAEQPFTIEADAEVAFVVDVKAGTVRRR